MLDKLITWNFIRLMAGIFAALLILSSCQPGWDNYYDIPAKSSKRMWEVVKETPDYSKFVELMQETGLDTIFSKEQSYTLIIPDNASFETFMPGNLTMDRVLGYHILNTVLIPSSNSGSRKIQTFFDKYALIEEYNHEYYFDGILITNPSGLYQDGMFYQISDVAIPKPTLYEYIDYNIQTLQDYIDGQDSIGFDPFSSLPIGFDEDGNTVYDSVFTSVNLFERDYFPVSLESRDKTATFLLYTQEQYDIALDQMADNLGSQFNDHNDIPLSWQNGLLLPYFLDYGVFNDALQFEDFNKPSLRNIQGTDVQIDADNIDPDSRYICSNGVVFNYKGLEVPLKLYMDTLRLEGEDLVTVPLGSEGYIWKNDVIASDYSKIPTVLTSSEASNGSYLSLALPRNSTELFSIEFTFKSVFPSRYQFIYRAKARPSGLIRFYVNDVLLGSVDNSKFSKTVDGNPSVGDFNHKAFFVENHTEYSDVNIKVEYTGPGILSNNGLCIDYIGLIPVK